MSDVGIEFVAEVNTTSTRPKVTVCTIHADVSIELPDPIINRIIINDLAAEIDARCHSVRVEEAFKVVLDTYKETLAGG